jgi:O-acetyl-ADP-ribose deacetylase (regulator of RNase III)
MIIDVKGNLLESPAVALVNTVNTVGVMGKGIALQFKKAFPYNFEVYRQACKNGELEIGKILAVVDRNLFYGDKLILNLPTKTHWRLPSEYIYIENGLVALRDYMLIHRVESIALPALGCGNGGLDWQKVKAMMEDALGDFQIPVWVYEP